MSRGAPDQSESAAFPWSLVPSPAPGQKWLGSFSWPDTVLRGWEWPCVAIHGARPGRSIAIVAASRGADDASVLGALRLGRALRPERASGSMLILPVANPPAFRERADRHTPLDGCDLSHSYPGRAIGAFSETVAFRILNDIVRPADAVIDLDGGATFESLASHTGRSLSGDADLDRLTAALVEGFGLPLALSCPMPPEPRRLTEHATLLGKAALAVQVAGNREEHALVVYQGLVNVLRALGILGGQIPSSTTHWLGPETRVAAPLDGLWRPAIEIEQRVETGDALGTIVNLLGDEIARVTSPASGMILRRLATLSVRAGDALAGIASNH